MFHHLREILFDIGYERRTAGACKESFFGKLSCLGKKHHICAESRFDHRMESQNFQAGDDLSEFCVSKLTGNRRSNHRIELVFCVVFALFDEVYNVENV